MDAHGRDLHALIAVADPPPLPESLEAWVTVTGDPLTWQLTPDAPAHLHQQWRHWREQWVTTHPITTATTARRLQRALTNAGHDRDLTGGWFDQAALAATAWTITQDLVLATEQEHAAAANLTRLATWCARHHTGARMMLVDIRAPEGTVTHT